MERKFTLPLITTALLLICGAADILPAQDMPPNILLIEIEEYHRGEPLRIRTTVTDDGKISELRLFFRQPGQLEYDFVDFQQEYDYFVAILQPEFLRLGKIEYYVFASDDQDNTRTSPEINPEINPYEFSVVVSVEGGRPTNIQVLSPEPGSIIPQGSELIIISLFDPDDDTDVKSIKLFVDGKDVTKDAQVSMDMITYAPPARMPVGPHRVEVVVVDREGNESPRKRFNFQVEPFTGEEPSAFKWNADFSLESQYDKYSGKEQPTYRPVDQTVPRLKVNGDWGWLRAEGELFYNMYIDDEAHTLSEQRQTLNRYRLKMTTKPLTLIFGDANPRFSELTIKGTRIRGVSGDSKLGFFGLSAFYGESRNRVNPYFIAVSDSIPDTLISGNLDTTLIYEKGVGSPTYKRDSYGVRTTFGYYDNFSRFFNKAELGFNYLRFTDDIDDSTDFYREIADVGGYEFAGLDSNEMSLYLLLEKNIPPTSSEADPYWKRWREDNDTVAGRLGRPKDNIVGSATLDFRFFKNTYLSLETAVSLLNDNLYGSRERIDELYEDREAGKELDDADKVILEIDEKMQDYFNFKVNDELIHTFSTKDIVKPTIYADLRTPLPFIPTQLRLNYRRVPETYNSLGNPSILKDVDAYKVDTRTRLFRNRVSVTLGGERREDNLYYAKEVTTTIDIISAGLNLMFPRYPSLNFGFRVNTREGVKDTTVYDSTYIDTSTFTIDTIKYSITSTDNKTNTFNIGSGYMFSVQDWRVNVNGNIMLMSYGDNINDDYNFSNRSYMLSSGVDAPWPWRFDGSFGYSINEPDAEGMESTVYNIFNSRFSYFFYNRKLTTFVGLDILTGKKDLDQALNYEIDNIKRTIKAGLKYKLSQRVSLSLQGENIDFEDHFWATGYENTSYSENRFTFRFDIRL